MRSTGKYILRHKASPQCVPASPCRKKQAHLAQCRCVCASRSHQGKHTLPLVPHTTSGVTHHPWCHTPPLGSHTSPGATLRAPGCPLQSHSFFHLGSLCARVQGHVGSLGAGAAGASFCSPPALFCTPADTHLPAGCVRICISCIFMVDVGN